ncbi:MAG: cutinase family protein [Mycobacterium sp.]
MITPGATTPATAADRCSDVEVVFARGTLEPEGVGETGRAFVDALRARLGGTSMDVYPVNYPASLDFPRAADGVADTSNEIMTLAAQCPNTKIVLGGYSQGAAVAAYTTADTVPAGFTLPAGIAGPMPASVANHIAAVALFGKPSAGFVHMLDRDAPPITIGHLYTTKTIDLCVPEDPVCAPGGDDQGAHGAYMSNGMIDQGADFAARAISRRT